MGSKWMCFCKRTACWWNLTYTSGFHASWAKNKSNLSLPATHEFRIKSGTAIVPSSKGKPATDSSSAGFFLTGYFIRHAGDLSQKNGDKTKAMLEHCKSNAEDSDLSYFFADLKTTWGFN